MQHQSHKRTNDSILPSLGTDFFGSWRTVSRIQFSVIAIRITIIKIIHSVPVSDRNTTYSALGSDRSDPCWSILSNESERESERRWMRGEILNSLPLYLYFSLFFIFTLGIRKYDFQRRFYCTRQQRSFLFLMQRAISHNFPLCVQWFDLVVIDWPGLVLVHTHTHSTCAQTQHTQSNKMRCKIIFGKKDSRPAPHTHTEKLLAVRSNDR